MTRAVDLAGVLATFDQPWQAFSEGAEVLLVEPSATVNTGDTERELTTTSRVYDPDDAPG